MKYKLFGNTGLRVSELALGAMTLGDAWGWGADKKESKKIVDLYLDKGGNFIDSANFYTNGESENFLGEITKDKRKQVVLATKYTLAVDPENPNAAGNHRKNLHEALNDSLKRLQTDYIDVLWVHAEDMFTPLEETMRALDDVIRLGKVLYIGVSDFPAWKIARANTLAELKNQTPFAGIQVNYSLIERSTERELLPMAKNMGLAATIWSPLAGGTLTGKYLEKAKKEASEKRYDVAPFADLLKVNEERNIKIVEELVKLAKESGKPAHHLALNWLRNNKEYDNLIPIIGAKNTQQLKDNLKILDFDLSDDIMQKLNEISKIELGFPNDFLEGVTGTVYGEKFDDIKTSFGFRSN